MSLLNYCNCLRNQIICNQFRDRCLVAKVIYKIPGVVYDYKFLHGSQFLCKSKFLRDRRIYTRRNSSEYLKKSLEEKTNISNSGLFGLGDFFIKLKQKLKEPFKIIFNILLGMFVLFKLLGYNIMDIFHYTPSYFSLYFYVLYSLKIVYELFQLTLLYLFYKKKVNIPEILPDIVIDWLNNFKIQAENKAGFNSFKNSYYIEIAIYIAALIIAIIIFN